MGRENTEASLINPGLHSATPCAGVVLKPVLSHRWPHSHRLAGFLLQDWQTGDLSPTEPMTVHERGLTRPPGESAQL